MSHVMQRANITFMKTLGYSEVFREPPQFSELSNLLHSFNFPELLMTLARMNILLFRSAGELSNQHQTQRVLKQNFLSEVVRNQIPSDRYSSAVVFHRHAILRLLHQGCLLSPPDSHRNFEGSGAMHELGRCFLMVNDLLATNGDAHPEQRLITEFIPLLEYANVPDIAKTMVRARAILQLVQGLSSGFDMGEVFRQATGLAMNEHQHIIFGIFGMYLRLTPQQVVNGQELLIDVRQMVRNTRDPDRIHDSYRKLLDHTCVAVGGLPDQVYGCLSATPLDEFHAFRATPLVRLKDQKIICIDPVFLANKLEAGVFWIVHEQLQKNGDDPSLLSNLWGTAFQQYTTSIVERATSVRPQGCILPSTYTGSTDECSDVILQDGDALVLLECKASLLTSDAKYNRRFHDLERDLRPKFIGTKKERKGIWQLWDGIRSLAHRDPSERRAIEDLDISGIRRIFPVLVVLEQALSVPWMNWYLESEFARIRKPGSLLPDIEVMPITVVTISDLEDLEPYLALGPLCKHLEKWVELYRGNNDASFRSYLHILHQRCPKTNQFMEDQFAEIKQDIADFYFSPDPD